MVKMTNLKQYLTRTVNTLFVFFIPRMKAQPTTDNRIELIPYEKSDYGEH